MDDDGTTAKEVVTASDILNNFRTTAPAVIIPTTTTTPRPTTAAKFAPLPPNTGPVTIGDPSLSHQPPGVAEVHKLHRRPFYWGGSDGATRTTFVTSTAVEQHRLNQQMIRGQQQQHQVQNKNTIIDQTVRAATHHDQQQQQRLSRTRATKEAPAIKSNYIDFRYGEKIARQYEYVTDDELKFEKKTIDV